MDRQFLLNEALRAASELKVALVMLDWNDCTTERVQEIEVELIHNGAKAER